jgi:Uri superfamily endonuclease
MIRKKRSDRNHVIYRMEMDTGDSYIGLTVAQGSAFLRSVKVRVQKHMSRARKEDKNWNLYSFLRENENTSITYEVLEVVRGRKPAHQRERELISEFNPTLNTF